MKKQELSKISEESQRLLKQLEGALAKHSLNQTIDPNISIIHYRLFSLQLKERHVRAAQEWPINMSFLSKLIVLGLIPILSRIVAVLLIS